MIDPSQCPNCSKPVETNWKFCPYCETALLTSCKFCGGEMRPDWSACPSCGTSGSYIPPVGKCHATKVVIQASDPHFTCEYCHELFLEEQKFEGWDEPACQVCAVRNGLFDLRELTRKMEKEEQERQKEEQERLVIEAAYQKEAHLKLEVVVQRALNEEGFVGYGVKDEQACISDLWGIKEEDWVLIQGGNSLDIGTQPFHDKGFRPDESHSKIALDDYQLLKTPVTWGMYLAFCFITKHDLPREPSWGQLVNHPVVMVNYWDAVDYAIWLSELTGWRCRLPTEAEWEFACCAGTSTPYSTGESISTNQANYDGQVSHFANGGGFTKKGVFLEQTTPSGQYPSNPWGLLDMNGNVWEWCSSKYHSRYYGGEQEDASNEIDDGQRVFRGGSWREPKDTMRTSYRAKNYPTIRLDTIGFRLVRDLE